MTFPQTPSTSIYLQAFEKVLDTVVSSESHLFTPEELELFEAYKNLEYDSRYLYVRLFLRKRGQWFRINKLDYGVNLPCAVHGLVPKFAHNLISLDEALSLLSLQELKDFAKAEKCRGTTKEQIKASLDRTSKTQLTLSTAGKIKRQKGTWTQKILDRTGPCIYLKDSPVAIFHRAQIVFFRTKEYNEKSLTTLILSQMSKRHFPEYIVCRTNNIFPSRQALLNYEASLKLQAQMEELLSSTSLGQAFEIFSSVYPRWTEIVKETPQDNDPSKYYLNRFTEGWVLTRLVHKGAYVLSRFQEYSREHQVLSSLLSQKMFCRGKRGEWWTRLALIEERYLEKGQLALQTAESALQDPDTHIIYHNALQKRIIRLERLLAVPKLQQHLFCHVQLKQARSRTVFGVLVSSDTGKKTVWRGEDGIECSVEALCLQVYTNEGWTGHHSENGVFTSLFALLFWDILFITIPGVFETEFQTAPLDLASDAFYPSRFSEINARLVLIENGGAANLVKQVYSREKPRQTWCVGLRWQYSVEELAQIAECIGPSALSQICRVFAEEYGHRASGMPDLCLWNWEKKQCLFSEVKGPKDRLSQTQSLWIDVLLNAGVDVELCTVEEK